ncbi:carbohydrate binding protein, partial [Streptomyces sp. KhCrAH-43]
MFRRIMGLLAALGAVVAGLVVLPAATASAADCAAAWNASSVYTGGGSASYNGHNWTAKWWTQNEKPGSSDVWADQGACGGGGTDPGDPGSSSGFVVSEAQFNQMFPGRSSFYTYSGLVAALDAYPGFANTGSDTVKKQEAAAFLANVSHETGGLVYVVEQNTANYPHYCDSSQPYGCPAGQAAYYGRGPIQLSWNFNYKAAG